MSRESAAGSDVCPETGPPRNLKLLLEYDGTAYSGWQRQANGLSIQQVLEEAIGRIAGQGVQVVGSGRTDAGVHALGQVAHCRLHSRISVRNLLLGINSLLPPDIALLALEEAPLTFHARFDTQRKSYIYRICNRPVRPALERHRTWFVWTPLDLTAMRDAAQVFLGEHDFTSFCSTHTGSRDRVRTVYSLTVEQNPEGMILIFLEANGFLRYMVRTIVGALVEVGQGKASPAGIAAILAAKDRRLAGLTVPPHGLYLKDVTY